MKKFDVIVVGGGLIGMLSARELRLAGMQVAVVERNQVGRESSWAGGGILSPLYPWRYPDPVSRLASWGQSVYPGLLNDLYQESGIDPEYQKSGLLITDTGERQQALAWAAQYQVNLQERDARQVEPGIGETGKALYLPEVGQVRNPRLAQSLKKAIEIQGVEIFEDSSVQQLLVANGKIEGITLDSGRLEAPVVVIAGGAWSAGLLAETGIELAVKPIRGQMLLFKAEAGVVEHIVLSHDRYVIPRRDGRILVGSTLEDVGFEKLTTSEAYNELFQEALRLIPALENYPVEHHWAGLRPASPEGIPYICKHPGVSGLFVNTGHYRNGVILGAASCRLLRNLVLGEAPIVEAEPYAISLK